MIYNAVGQLVVTKNYSDVGLIKESVGDLPAGLYSLVLYADNKFMLTQKMVVER